MTLRDQIAQQAMTLPPEDREYVVELLERSLSAGEFHSAEIAEAWSQEIDRRIAAYDRGDTTAVDFDTALDNMQRALAIHRANKGIR